MRGGRRKHKKNPREYLTDFAVFAISALLVIMIFWLLRPKLMQFALEMYSNSSRSSADDYYEEYSDIETGVE